MEGREMLRIWCHVTSRSKSESLSYWCRCGVGIKVFKILGRDKVSIGRRVCDVDQMSEAGRVVVHSAERDSLTGIALTDCRDGWVVGVQRRGTWGGRYGVHTWEETIDFWISTLLVSRERMDCSTTAKRVKPGTRN
jgi:hypothetical protein